MRFKSDRARQTYLRSGEFRVSLNGTTILYAVRGRGPVVMVMPNAWGLSHEGLRALFRSLEGSLTVVYFDPRGMGRSAAIKNDSDMSMATVRGDFDALRRHLQLEKVHAMGWSNGGFNLLKYAGEYPDAVDSVVIVHAAANFSKADSERLNREYPDLVRKSEVYKREMGEGRYTETAQNRRQKAFIINEWFLYLFADREWGRKKLVSLYKNTGFSWKHLQYSQTVDAPNLDARDALKNIRCPLLLIAGAHDLVPPERIKEIQRELAQAQFVVFEKSAHYAPIEERELFKTVVTRFVRSRIAP